MKKILDFPIEARIAAEESKADKYTKGMLGGLKDAGFVDYASKEEQEWVEQRACSSYRDLYGLSIGAYQIAWPETISRRDKDLVSEQYRKSIDDAQRKLLINLMLVMVRQLIEIYRLENPKQ